MEPAIIRTLVAEHETILEVLDALTSFARSAHTENASVRRTLADYVKFCREFVDNLHHGKEEELLFVRMCEAGLPRDAGPIAVMLGEHDLGRAAVGALARLAAAVGPLSPDELANLRANARAFADLLTRHITKENSVLYPMARRLLTSECLETLDRQAREFDEARAERKLELLDMARTLVTPHRTVAVDHSSP